MEKELYDLIWKYSEKPTSKGNFEQLASLTERLIQSYERQGRLLDDPFSPSRERSLRLPIDLVTKAVRNKVCLVTGGLGCVGSSLVRELIGFNPKLIVVLDIDDPNKSSYQIPEDERIVFEKCSILDFSGVMALFALYCPQVVFHTAAQRNPGLAETQINFSVQTNVLGTYNLLSAVKSSLTVEHFVFSSTGKASRYYTEEVYASTKKICEMLVDYFSKSCPEKFFSMVRFTHIVDNSLMDIELANSAKNEDYVAIHSPGKFVTAQNVKEAAYLMLNALIYAESGKANFLLVKNLEWPVESLEVALYYIKLHKRRIPIVFVGNPKGYGEKFFRGQLDWSSPGDLNLLINVYENRTKRLNPAKDIAISSIIPSESDCLEELVESLQNETGELETKEILNEGLKRIFIGSLKKVDKAVTFDILKWGIDPKFLNADKIEVSDFGEMVPLLANSLTGTVYFDRLREFFEGQLPSSFDSLSN